MELAANEATDIPGLRRQLAQFCRYEVAPALSAAARSPIQAALQTFNDWSDYQTLGICADTLGTAQAAMESYLAALGVTVQLDLPPRSGSVYLKFNTLKGAWYLEDYSGTARGVLVSFHASDPAAELVNGTYGPFPFDLFEAFAASDGSVGEALS